MSGHVLKAQLVFSLVLAVKQCVQKNACYLKKTNTLAAFKITFFAYIFTCDTTVCVYGYKAENTSVRQSTGENPTAPPPTRRRHPGLQNERL